MYRKSSAVQGVPKFMIFKKMELVEEFSTRDKQRLVDAIGKHANRSKDELETELQM
jgi:hypothetical protein